MYEYEYVYVYVYVYVYLRLSASPAKAIFGHPAQPASPFSCGPPYYCKYLLHCLSIFRPSDFFFSAFPWQQASSAVPATCHRVRILVGNAAEYFRF